MRTKISKFLLTVLLIIINLQTSQEAVANNYDSSVNKDSNIILYYISNSWKTLQRSMEDCKTFSDPKTHIQSLLYLPANVAQPDSLHMLEKKCGIRIKHLPKVIKKFGELDVEKLQPPGLLYLPHPYIVPGGMFNEMYGWDSYFIIRGLIEDQKLELAQGMLENFFFEIKHYGGILNGNRTYYLTRTQLPFLAPTIRAIYEADHTKKQVNKKWLFEAYEYAEKDYAFWTHAPHLAGKTGLSRYFDVGDGPVSELDDTAKSYYEDVVRYFLVHPEIAEPYLMYLSENETLPKSRSLFTISLCNPSKEKNKVKSCKLFKNVGLSDIFYKGDRAMRESGFDTSFRFGPFSADTLHYAPLDLNCLLYKAEKDLEWMSNELNMPKKALKWKKLAKLRRDRVNHYLWNDKLGIYVDYNFKTKEQSTHMYATTFYPLWAGIASSEQARRVIKTLKLFEQPGGIVTSLHQTGVQWDYPYGWAPIQLIAIEGLYQYGYREDADRISNKFLLMVLKNFMKERTIREKYDVVSGTSKTNIQIGYKLNVPGFGWTNGVFLVLLNKLPPHIAANILSFENTPKAIPGN